MKDAIQAGTVTVTGHGGDEIEAYLARPLGDTPRGGVVVIHHMPGYDIQTKEIVRRFATEGYASICPNLYVREAPGACIVNPPPAGMPLKVVPLLGIAGQLFCPLLGLFGADDSYPGPEETAALS